MEMIQDSSTNKYHHVISLITRKIYRMTTSEMNSYAVSGEFVLKNHDKMYDKFLKNGMIWDFWQAIHLLAREDPNDPHWLSSSGYPKSLEFEAIKKALTEDHRMGKISLTRHRDFDGKLQFIAENIVFIRWAIERGYNVPELFKEYFESYLSNQESENSKSLKQSSTDVFLSNEIREKIRRGEIAQNNLQQASKKAVEANKEKVNQIWGSYLDQAYNLAKKEPNKWTANSLANHMKLNGIPTEIKTATFRRKIAMDERIKPLLRKWRKNTISKLV